MLKSIRTDNEVRYHASCSCDKWKKMASTTVTLARIAHAEHLQSLLGPEAQAARTKEGE
jgi:hypothetical protein